MYDDIVFIRAETMDGNPIDRFSIFSREKVVGSKADGEPSTVNLCLTVDQLTKTTAAVGIRTH